MAIGVAALWFAFAYLGYPIVLLVLRSVSPRRVAAADVFPPLSVVIAVHNGERELKEKLESTLALGYPGPREILVSSDGSTDRSVEIAEAFADRGVKLVEAKERGGKEAAQKRAIARAEGEILVFTDVSARLEPDALRNIVRPFADPSVGAVSSEDVVEGEEGEGAYVRYEMALRRLENEATTLAGLSGSFFAIRRELADPWPADLASDFRCALAAARAGYRAVSEPTARARFLATSDPAAEWRRKVRTVRRGLAVLFSFEDLLHPRHGRVALTLWGHKVARFTSPFALVVMLVVSLCAAPFDRGLATFAALQVACYVTGLLALRSQALRAFMPLRLAGFFIVVNASILVAWGHHLRGERAVIWAPTVR